jgi:hypothetical protein
MPRHDGDNNEFLKLGLWRTLREAARSTPNWRAMRLWSEAIEAGPFVCFSDDLPVRAFAIVGSRARAFCVAVHHHEFAARAAKC